MSISKLYPSGAWLYGTRYTRAVQAPAPPPRGPSRARAVVDRWYTTCRATGRLVAPPVAREGVCEGDPPWPEWVCAETLQAQVLQDTDEVVPIGTINSYFEKLTLEKKNKTKNTKVGRIDYATTVTLWRVGQHRPASMRQVDR